MNIWYLDNNNAWQYSENSTIIKLQDMLQRLQTFKGEQSFNAGNGIDYLNVFNKRSFLKPQIESIISNYTKYFQDINYTLEYTTNESITIKLEITLFTGDVALATFTV